MTPDEARAASLAAEAGHFDDCRAIVDFHLALANLLGRPTKGGDITFTSWGNCRCSFVFNLRSVGFTGSTEFTVNWRRI